MRTVRGRHLEEAVRIGVVGCGVMGRNHVRVLADTKGFELVGIVDHNVDVRESAARASGATACATVEELIALGIDAAVVALPTSLHFDVGSQLIRSGIHVLMEKPIARTVEEAHALVALADEHDRRLVVGHVERFNPAIEGLRQAIGEEEILSVAVTRVGPFPPRIGDVGIVIDLGVHDIDLIRWLTRSEILDHQTLVSRTIGEHEDIAFMQFRMESGALASINTNWLTPFKQRRIDVSTRHRFISCDMLLRTVSEFSRYQPDGGYLHRSIGIGFHEPLKAELQAFRAAILGTAPVAVTGADGARVLEIALAALRDA
jgi:UDP-N-acetylglucosamine 3-dehydrogenase